MRNIILFSFCCIFMLPVWAAQPLAQSLLPTSLLPMTNQAIGLTPQHLLLKPNTLLTTEPVKAGGYGGNERIGQLIYSGIPSTLPALNMMRDSAINTCYFINKNVVIKHDFSNRIINKYCFSPDPEHNDLYWNANFGAVNGGYSPENDALYAGDVITNMFIDWYGIYPLKDNNGMQMPITFRLHSHMDNATLVYPNEATIGDGISMFYPLTSLNVLSYMTGGLFTHQNAALNWSQSETGGIDIAFSCMTAQAAEFYVTGKNTWQLGAEVAKNGEAVHYMDVPSKNCKGRNPGDHCDIDTLAQYKQEMQPHYTSGLFNRAFYLLATTNGWNTRKAYDVFVRANRFHWKPTSNFKQGACGVVASALEMSYDKAAVMKAFSGVGIDTRDC